MKMPHVTIEYVEEEDTGFDRVSPSLVIGFGIHWAWIYAFMFNISIMIPTETPFIYQTLTFGISLAILSLTLLSYGLFLKGARRLFRSLKQRRRNRFIAALCVFVSMLLICLAVLMPQFALACAIVSGLLSGFGSAVLLMSYGISFSVCELPNVVLYTPIAFLVAFVCVTAIVAASNLLAPLGMLLCLCLPFLEWLCLRRCSTQLVDRTEFASITMPIRTPSFAWRIGLPSLILGFVLGILRDEAVQIPDIGEYIGPTMVAIFGASILAIILFVLAILTQRHSTNFVFRVTSPIMAILIATTVLAAPDSPYMIFAALGAYLILESCMWILYSDISQRYHISAFTVFGFGRGSLALGTLVAFLLALPESPAAGLFSSTVAIVLITLVGLILGLELLPNMHEIHASLRRNTSAQTQSEFEEEEEKLVEEETAEEVSAPTETVIDEGAQQEKGGRFKHKCRIAAERYLLSSRETEVLFLLAKGWGSAAIQERLYISSGTVNTHMRHIYRKLDVHSQQELMNLVNDIEVDDRGDLDERSRGISARRPRRSS